MIRLKHSIANAFLSIFTLRTISLRALARCPFQDRRGGPWKESQAAKGRRLYTSLRGVVSSRQSNTRQPRIDSRVGLAHDASKQHWLHSTGKSTYMLVNKQDSDVLALFREAIKGGFNRGRLGLGVND